MEQPPGKPAHGSQANHPDLELRVEGAAPAPYPRLLPPPHERESEWTYGYPPFSGRMFGSGN